MEELIEVAPSLKSAQDVAEKRSSVKELVNEPAKGKLEIVTMQDKFDRCKRCRWNSFLIEGTKVEFYSRDARETICENCTGGNFQKMRKDDVEKFRDVIRAKHRRVNKTMAVHHIDINDHVGTLQCDKCLQMIVTDEEPDELDQYICPECRRKMELAHG